MQHKVSDARLAVKVCKIYSVREFNVDRHIGINMKTVLLKFIRQQELHVF